MIVNEAFRFIIYDSRAMHKIVASLTNDSRGIIDDCNMFIVQTTDHLSVSVTSTLPYYLQARQGAYPKTTE